MKKQWLRTAAVVTGVIVAGLAMSTPSEARPSHGHGHGHGRSHLSLNLGFGVGPYWGSAWGPRYYGPTYYYRPYPYYRPYYEYSYAPPPPPPATPYFGTGISATVGLDLFPAPLGDHFDDHTKDTYYGAYRQALAAPVGDTVTWTDAGVSGSVTTTRDGWAGQQYCREFRQTINVDGRRQDAVGTTCRDPNGVWQLVPNQR